MTIHCDMLDDLVSSVILSMMEVLYTFYVHMCCNGSRIRVPNLSRRQFVCDVLWIFPCKRYVSVRVRHQRHIV